MRKTSARHALAALLLAAALPAAAGPQGPADPVRRPAARSEEITVDSDFSQGRQGSMLTARGNVRVRYQDVVVEADQVELDQDTRELVAQGNVVLAERDRRIAGERLEFNFDTREGRIHVAWGYADPDVHFTARRVEKHGTDVYELAGPEVTSCNQPLPHWRMRASRGSYRADEWVRLWNVRLEVLGVPLLYVPWLQYPAKEDRSTGFLFPSFGVNNTFGTFIGNAFFWAINRSYDATVAHEWYTKRGHLIRGEFQYVPSPDIAGRLSSENFFDEFEDRVRSQYRASHNQRFADTWRAGADVNYSSDEAIDSDYSNNVSRLSSRTRTSGGFVQRQWSRYSMGVAAGHQVLLAGSGDGTTRERSDYRLPAAEFRVRDSRLAGPLYGRLGSSAAWFGTRADEPDYFTWGRFDLEPTLIVPLRPYPWLQLRAEASERVTYYSESYEPGTDRQVLSSESYLRAFPRVSAAVTGPVFTRVFHTPGNFYAEKYKHLIEPTVQYEYTGDIDPDEQAILIDGVDRLPAVDQVTVGVRNRWLAKRTVRPGLPAVPYEFLSFGLGIAYSLAADRGTVLGDRNYSGVVSGFAGDRQGPLVGDLRFVPADALAATYRFYYDTDETLFSAQSLQATGRWSGGYADFTYTRNRDVDSLTSHQVRGQAVVEAGHRFQLGGNVSYDLLADFFQQLGGNVTYRTQCCGFGFGYNRFRFGSRDDDQWRFSLSLKNIGTVFDYTLGDDRL